MTTIPPTGSRPSHTDRRDFLKRTLAGSFVGGLGLGVGPSRNTFAEKSPNEKLNLALIGCGNRARSNISGVSDQNIVAICDVDSKYMGTQKEAFPDARMYADYRKLFDRELPTLDGVVVSTADHSHFLPTAIALSQGKHVYCEKPLTHTVEEARMAAKLAKTNNCITQMGTQIHAGDNYRRVVEMVRAGMIGEIQQIEVWCKKGWSDGRNNFAKEVPERLDWDLWLGPAAERPYIQGVHPANWRRYWDFGAGTLGDMGCHIMDLAFWAGDLTAPTTVSAKGSDLHPVGCPADLHVTYEFPKTDQHPALTLNWYDGGKLLPPQLAEIKKTSGQDLAGWGIGCLFIGTKGMLAANYGSHALFDTEGHLQDYAPPEQTIPNSIGHYREWIEGCKTGTKTTCDFAYSGNLTQTVLLGTVAFRNGAPIEWDDEAGRVTNSDEANEFVAKEYRKGWTPKELIG